jgi:hypothetical protein
MNKLALALGLLLSAVAAEYTTTLLFVGLELDSQAIGGYVGSVIGTVCPPKCLKTISLYTIFALGASNTGNRMPQPQPTP